jgi:hypothetical protein
VTPNQMQRFIDYFGPFSDIPSNCRKFILSGSYGKITRATAENLLQLEPDGSYIFRPSDTNYVLTLTYKIPSGVFHRRIINPVWDVLANSNNPASVGEDSKFEKLIENYKTNQRGIKATPNAHENIFVVNVLKLLESLPYCTIPYFPARQAARCDWEEGEKEERISFGSYL